MSHLSEKLAEFVFGELSAPEMAEAQRHLAECADCRQEIESFQSTYAMLKSSPDAEPPRRILFEFEKPRATGWIWRWLAPMAASAAVAWAVVTFSPRPQPQVASVQQQAAVQQLIDGIRAELKDRDAAETKEFQRVRGQMELLEAYQQSLDRDIAESKSAMQLYAANGK
jgi:anti-sigma factor RsiW